MPTRLLRRQVRNIDGATLTTSYQNLGTVVTIAAYKIAIVNSSTTAVQIQDQTTNDAFYIPAGSTLAIGEGLTGSGQYEDTKATEPANTQYQIKLSSGAAGTGFVVITILGY